MKTFDYRLQRKLKEVYFVEPNDLGFPFITKIYHRISKFFKTIPFIFIIPLSFFTVFVLYIFFGSLLVKLVSILQYGF